MHNDRRARHTKPPAEHGIKTPRLPKDLNTQTPTTLDDDAEYFAVSVTGSEFVKQAASPVIFEQALLRRVNFSQSRLPGLRLLDVRLEACDVTGAIWEQARLQRVIFDGSRLTGIQFLEARCEDVVFQDCVLEGAIFASATFRAARFENCNLREAVFTAADLTNVVFRRCDLAHADLRGGKLAGADLRGSIINGMQVGAPELKGAIIDPTQAVQVVSVLGIVVKDADE